MAKRVKAICLLCRLELPVSLTNVRSKKLLHRWRMIPASVRRRIVRERCIESTRGLWLCGNCCFEMQDKLSKEKMSEWLVRSETARRHKRAYLDANQD